MRRGRLRITLVADDSLSRLRDVVDQIADMHDARVDKHQMDDGTWIVSIEHDDWNVTPGSGVTEAEALSELIQNARAEGVAL